MSDFFTLAKTAAAGIATAQKKTAAREAALVDAQEAESRAWAVLYAIPGVTAETAAQITRCSLVKCKAEFSPPSTRAKSGE